MNTSVKLKAITKPEDDLTVDEFIAYVARVSNPANQNNKKTAPKLIKYLIENKHFSPFEMVNLVFEIETTRDISRQILRHDDAFQEFSQRYAEAQKFVTNREARLQDLKNRQNSIKINDNNLQEWFENQQRQVVDFCNERYKEALAKGIAKEQARVFLPEGLTVTTLYIQGTLRNLMFWCLLRMGNGTQEEHAEIAKQCWNIICERFPSIKKAFNQEQKEKE